MCVSVVSGCRMWRWACLMMWRDWRPYCQSWPRLSVSPTLFRSLLRNMWRWVLVHCDLVWCCCWVCVLVISGCPVVDAVLLFLGHVDLIWCPVILQCPGSCQYFPVAMFVNRIMHVLLKRWRCQVCWPVMVNCAWQICESHSKVSWPVMTCYDTMSSCYGESYRVGV